MENEKNLNSAKDVLNKSIGLLERGFYVRPNLDLVVSPSVCFPPLIFWGWI